MSYYSFDQIDNFSIAGFTLSTEEKICLRSSLTLKQDEEKFENMFLWGKLLGIHNDYFIAQGLKGNVFKRKYFYTTNLTTWLELPDVSKQDISYCEKIQGRLMGDPTFDHELPPQSEAIADLKIKEDVRISGIIQLINRDVEIVPRKAYYRDAQMQIVKNPTFSGLERDEIGQLNSYFHFRDGFELTSRTLSERMNTFDESIDVFESINNDVPKEAWSVQTENNDTVVLIRNMLWPGYTFVHTKYPVSYQQFYYGTGQRNHNLGYML